MANQAVFLNYTQEIPVTKTSTPEFYQLYQRSLLLALKELDILNDIQIRQALDLLKHQTV